jgi:hypothetical protein
MWFAKSGFGRVTVAEFDQQLEGEHQEQAGVNLLNTLSA